MLTYKQNAMLEPQMNIISIWNESNENEGTLKYYNETRSVLNNRYRQTNAIKVISEMGAEGLKAEKIIPVGKTGGSIQENSNI
jgi:hypothetical protein